uniref:Uncharacterized protein n=1 Tax=Arundo donax TaxID=35708 RepID=A0A0A9EXH9_ARUDO
MSYEISDLLLGCFTYDFKL